MVEEEGGQFMKGKHNKTIVIISFLLFTLIVIPMSPSILLGFGNLIDFTPQFILKPKVEKYLTEKFKEKFEVTSIKESSLNGIYEGNANALDQNFLFHITAYKNRGNFYFQDDYNLQKLIVPIIEKRIQQKDYLYKIEYSYPDMFGNITEKLDWDELLKKRSETHISVNIFLYTKGKYEKENYKNLIDLENDVQLEDLNLLNLVVVEIDSNAYTKNIIDRELRKDSPELLGTCSLSETKFLECSNN